MEVNIINENKGGGAVPVIAGIIGVALSLATGAAVGYGLNKLLPAATTIPEKVVRWGAITGATVATQYVVSEAVTADVMEMSGMATKAALGMQAKLAAKKLKAEEKNNK